MAGILRWTGATLLRSAAPIRRDALLTMRAQPDRRVKLVAMTDNGRKAITFPTRFSGSPRSPATPTNERRTPIGRSFT